MNCAPCNPGYKVQKVREECVRNVVKNKLQHVLFED